MNYDDEFDVCSFCGWCSAFEEGHIIYCSLRSGCEYIRSLYYITLEDDDGEPYFRVKNKLTGEVKIYDF